MWGTIKCTNLHVIGITEGGEREKESKNVIEEVMAENFPNLKKETDIQARETQRVPNEINIL